MNSIRKHMLAAVTVACTTVSAQKSITNEVCWIDGDIATAQSATSAIDISALASGLHAFSIRVQDSEGLWSPTVTRYFIVPYGISKATAIAEQEYWIDDGVAARTALGNSPAQVSLVSLAQGMHAMTVRVKDNAGQWSSPVTRYFIVPVESQQEEVAIARYMYWIDGNTENIVSGTIDEGSGTLPVFVAGMAVGEHTLTWRVADSKDVWSEPQTETFIVVTATSIATTFADDLNDGTLWYSLDGTKLDKLPAAPGVYIRNGKKVVVK